MQWEFTVEETLKWEKLSYRTNKGSIIIDSKVENPDQYALKFKRTSTFVTTLKAIYKDTIKNVNTRALVFQMDQTFPTEEIKQCIKAALTYQIVKKSWFRDNFN